MDMTVKEFVEILNSVPDNFKDSVVFINGECLKRSNIHLDTEHGELDLNNK